MTMASVIDMSQIDSAYLDMCTASDGSQAALPVSMTGRIFYWDKTNFSMRSDVRFLPLWKS